VLGLLIAWCLATTGLAAGSGGFASPLAASLLIAPALALALARPWLGWVGVFAAGSYCAAGVLGAVEAAANLGAFPVALTFVALSLVVWLMTRTGRRRDGAERWRVAEAAHELRTPLTHIMGFAEMIERRMFGAEIADRYVEYARLIRRSGGQLLAMVNDLLDLSSIEAGRHNLALVSFDVREVVAEVVRMALDAAAAKQINLAIVTPETPLVVNADRDAIRRMLTNIVGNAIKFTPQNGEVFVSAVADRGALLLESRDNGPGFADVQALGQPYERGAARESGTGLGLALVRALAQQHGGDVTFLDAPGGGALVRIHLPVLSAGS
jgi:signal transduction histidine kinase